MITSHCNNLEHYAQKTRIRTCIHCRQPENNCAQWCIDEGDELERKTKEATEKSKVVEVRKPIPIYIHTTFDTYLTRTYGIGDRLSHFNSRLGGFYNGQEL